MESISAIALGAFIAILSSYITQTRQFAHERTLESDRRNAEFQRETLTSLQIELVDMVRIAHDSYRVEVAASTSIDEERKAELLRKRDILDDAEWDAMWKVRTVRHRLQNTALRSRIAELEEFARMIATSTHAERVASGLPNGPDRMRRQLSGLMNSVGEELREFEHRSLTQSLPWWRRLPRVRGIANKNESLQQDE
jgi:hypothetical protein